MLTVSGNKGIGIDYKGGQEFVSRSIFGIVHGALCARSSQGTMAAAQVDFLTLHSGIWAIVLSCHFPPSEYCQEKAWKFVGLDLFTLGSYGIDLLKSGVYYQQELT